MTITYTYKCEVCGYEFYCSEYMESPFHYKEHVNIQRPNTSCNGRFYKKYEATPVILKGTGYTKGHVR